MTKTYLTPEKITGSLSRVISDTFNRDISVRIFSSHRNSSNILIDNNRLLNLNFNGRMGALGLVVGDQKGIKRLRWSLSREEPGIFKNGTIEFKNILIDMNNSEIIENSIEKILTPGFLDIEYIHSCLTGILQEDGPWRSVILNVISGYSAEDCCENNFSIYLHSKFQELLFQLNKELESRDYYDITDTLTSFTGLGPGSTPSGDDFLLGLISVFQIFNQSFNSNCLIAEIKEKIKSRSTLLSYYMFKELEYAYIAPEYFHLLYSLTLNNISETRFSISNLKKHGNYSGEDFLSGVFFGILHLNSLKEQNILCQIM